MTVQELDSIGDFVAASATLIALACPFAEEHGATRQGWFGPPDRSLPPEATLPNADVLGCRAHADWTTDHRRVPGYPIAIDHPARRRPCLGFSFPIAA